MVLRRPHSETNGKQNNSDYYGDIFLENIEILTKYKSDGEVQELHNSSLQENSPWLNIARERNRIILGVTEQTKEPKEQMHLNIIEKLFRLGMDSKK